jgi:hypothetical protein
MTMREYEREPLPEIGINDQGGEPRWVLEVDGGGHYYSEIDILDILVAIHNHPEVMSALDKAGISLEVQPG